MGKLTLETQTAGTTLEKAYQHSVGLAAMARQGPFDKRPVVCDFKLPLRALIDRKRHQNSSFAMALSSPCYPLGSVLLLTHLLRNLFGNVSNMRAHMGAPAARLLVLDYLHFDGLITRHDICFGKSPGGAAGDAGQNSSCLTPDPVIETSFSPKSPSRNP